ncbi:MAG: hypothetical protein V4697_03945, partial [Patescibacteria group bacterium]
MTETLIQALLKALQTLGVADPKVKLEHPEDISLGDFTTNAALAYAKELKMSPQKLAEAIVLECKKGMPENV